MWSRVKNKMNKWVLKCCKCEQQICNQGGGGGADTVCELSDSHQETNSAKYGFNGSIVFMRLTLSWAPM